MEIMRDLGSIDAAAATSRRNAAFTTKRNRYKSPNPTMTGTQLGGLKMRTRKKTSRKGTRLVKVKPEDRRRHNP